MATEEDKVDVGKIFTIGVVGAILTYSLVVAAQYVHFYMGEAEFARKNANPPRELAEYLEKQEQELGGYGYVDKDAKTVSIPIERAIAMTVASGGALPEIKKNEPAADASPAELGKGLYASLGCNACHSLDGSKVVGPSFKGIWGEQHKFTNGEQAQVNLAYVKNSVLYPASQIVEGYPPVMPAYEGRVSDEDLSHIAAFIESLGGDS